MQDTEKRFRELFINQEVKDIKFYHINENFMVFDPDHKWVIEGGVEFVFESYSISFGWNSDMQLFDMIQGKIEELIGEMDVYELDFSEHRYISIIPGKKIEEISFSWTWYQKMDEEMELVEEKTYIPQELRIKFEGELLFQVATIVFKLKDKQMQKPTFDSQSMMLVTVNQPIDILEAEAINNLEEE